MNNGFAWLQTKALIVLRTTHFRSQVWRWFWRSIRPGTVGVTLWWPRPKPKTPKGCWMKLWCLLVLATVSYDLLFEELLQGRDEAASGQSQRLCPKRYKNQWVNTTIASWTDTFPRSEASHCRIQILRLGGRTWGGHCARALWWRCAEQNQFQSFDGVHAFQEDPALFSEHFQHRRRASASQIQSVHRRKAWLYTRSKHAKLLNHVCVSCLWKQLRVWEQKSLSCSPPIDASIFKNQTAL